MKKLTLFLLVAVVAGCVAAYAVVSVITGSATATYVDSTGKAYTAESNIISVSVTREPALKVTLTADKADVRPGEVVKYSLTTQNTSTETAYDVRLKLSDSLGGGTVDVGELGPGQTITKTVEGRIQ